MHKVRENLPRECQVSGAPNSPTNTRIRKSAPKNTAKSYPRTVEEAVERPLSEMSDENKRTLRELPEGDLVGATHFGLGMYIRNQFGLWGKNAELMKACGAYDPHDASSVIIRALWRRLNQNQSDLPPHREYLSKHSAVTGRRGSARPQGRRS
jgi:uncharacterized protein DUF6794